MIFFGTRGVKSTLKSGTFHCPQCETNESYKHIKVKKFFTLYFIPIIPLSDAGEYVECHKCKGTYIPKVLNYNKSAGKDEFLSQYEKAMKHCMIMIMLADGRIDEEEMLMVQKIINKFGHNDLTLDQLEALVERIEKNPENISTYLKRITPSLNEHGKETIIKCALSVAAADGNIDKSELEVIKKMAVVMEMSSSHLKGIFADISSKKEHSFSNN